MKILLISNFYPPYVFGGYELYAQAIVSGLKNRGHEVYVLTSQVSPPDEKDVFSGEDAGQILSLFPLKINNFYKTSQVNIFKKVFRFFFNPRNFAITRDVISNLNPDIISIWNLRLLSIAPLIASAWTNKPLVLHLYDPWLVPLKIFKPFPWIMGKAINIRHVITCSRSLACQYEAAGIRKDYITILPHGIAIYPPKPLALADNNGRKLLIVSSLTREKGVDIVLKALSILVNKKGRNHLTLDIYGDGEPAYCRHLRAIIKAERIEPYVHFKGRVEPELLPEVFAGHYLFISPERWATLPLVLLQAMASEMPVIGIDNRGMEEVIEDEINGLLIPPDNPEEMAEGIDRLDRDRTLRENLAQKARQVIIDRFNIEGDIKKIENYYFELIKK